MPNSCTPRSDAEAAVDRAAMAPASTGSNEQTQQQPGSQNNARRILREEADAAAQQELLEAAAVLNGAASPDPTYQNPTRKDTAQARTIGRRALKFLAKAGANIEGRLDALDTAIREATGTTISSANAWMNFQNWMSKNFVNQRADLDLWADVYARAGGRPDQNPLIQAAHGMIPKVRGIQTMLTREQASVFNPLVRPLIARTGRSESDIMAYGGMWLNCRHASEGNQYLLNKWDRISKAAQAKIEANTPIVDRGVKPDGAKATATEVRKAKSIIDDAIAERREAEIRWRSLTDNLDNANPDDSVYRRGYTNGQARVLMRRILKESGLSEAELDGLAKAISGQMDRVTEELASAGVIHREQLEAIPDFKWYASQRSAVENNTGVNNDTTHYVPGARHAMEGMNTEPANAYSTLGAMTRRAATEIGTQDLGAQLAAIHKQHKRLGKDFGLRAYSYNELLRHSMSRDRNERAIADALLNNGGVAYDMPVREDDGSLGYRRTYYWFDPKWTDGKLTGRALNEAMTSAYKLGSKPEEAIAKLTSYAGQSHTRFSPFFAPLAGMRDAMERMFQMSAREFHDADGNIVKGTSMLREFVGNTNRAMNALYKFARGQELSDTGIAALFDEYRRSGLYQKFTPGQGQEARTIDELSGGGNRLSRMLRRNALGEQAGWLENNRQLSWLSRSINRATPQGRKALEVLDSWNDVLQNAPSFAQYITMREKGMSMRQAAAETLNIMNMSQQGNVAQHLAVIAPFVRPTMQGAKVFAQAMGLSGRNSAEILKYGKKGWMIGLGASAAYAVLYPMIRESLGYDEHGSSYFDAMPVSRLTSFTMIGLGDGSYIKAPSGFGPQRVAATLGLCFDRVSRGLMDPAEAAFEVLFATARDVVPGNQPAFAFADNPSAFITQMVIPAPFKAFAENAANTNYFGGPIYDDYDSSKSYAEMGRKSTAPFWHKAARIMRQSFGYDYAPETYKHLAEGMALGPLKMLTSAIVNFAEADSVRRGFDKPTAMEEMSPILAAMGGTLWYGRERNVGQHYYYEAKRELENKAKQLGVRPTKDGERGEKGLDTIREKLTSAGMERTDIDDYIKLLDIDKRLRGAGRAFNEKHKYFYDEPDSVELRQDFITLADDSDALYNEFIQNSNYYRGRR